MYDKNNFIEFEGEKYYLRSTGYYMSKPKLLHREIWKSKNGEIPEGHVIHHIDHNKLNNDASNLQCLEKGRHDKHHSNLKNAKKS